MDDQVRVRVRDRAKHVQEEPQAGLDGQRALVAVAVDALPVDVLQHEVRLPRRGDARVDQLGDVRVVQAREDAALAAEAALALAGPGGSR